MHVFNWASHGKPISSLDQCGDIELRCGDNEQQKPRDVFAWLTCSDMGDSMEFCSGTFACHTVQFFISTANNWNKLSSFRWNLVIATVCVMQINRKWFIMSRFATDYAQNISCIMNAVDQNLCIFKLNGARHTIVPVLPLQFSSNSFR